ncbi:MAG TPA: ABC transporter permease [Candidatus Acidoferrum sp.]|jgi:putative ABC transport system permease protein|nr:ABC transporter permease [Candidatus Acidoferrum sp.]
MGSLIQNARYALRALSKNPGFAAVAIITLALGIGANTAIFSVVDTVLLRPLPYPDPDRIVQLQTSFPGGGNGVTSIPKFMAWRDLSQVFDDASLYDLGVGRMNMTGGDRPEQLSGIHVSASYFKLFGARLAQGRTFTAEEDIPNGPRVAVISNGLWRSRYGSDPAMVGKNIEIGGQPYEVVGILDPSFRWDPASDIWLPLQADPNSANQGNYLLSAARLKPGVSVAQAKAAMTLAADQFRRKYPRALGPRNGFTVQTLEEAQVANVRTALYLLLGTVAFVLLIACANIANLLLARAAVRRREIAIRSALGAGRRRIINQLLTESVLLSLVGGALGLMIGFFGVRTLLAMNPGNIPRIGDKGAALSLDWRVLVFTLIVSVFTGILFGLIPALHASRVDLNITLKESGSRSGSGFRQNKARSILVVVEMALALILLAGSALLIRTYIALRQVQPGFDSHNILTMNMSLGDARFAKTAGVAQLVRDGVDRIDGLPGVEAAATTCSLPLEPSFGLGFAIEGRPEADPQNRPGGAWRSVSPNYFSVFKIPIVRGRAFTDRDDGGAAPVVLVNEALVKQYFPKDDPIGMRITIGKDVGPQFSEPPRQIIGIVGDVRDGGLNANPFPIMYIPVSQVTDGMTALNEQILPIMWVVRTKVAPYSLSQEIQRELRAASGGLPVGHIRSMEQVVGESTARQDFNTTLLTIFAGVALLLAAVGIYGLMAYSVQQRTQEIGIRMALGAAPQKVRGMIVWQGMQLVLAGVLIGVGAGLALTRLMASMIFGVKAWDPTVFVAVTVVLSVVALFATYIPARRAAHVDPLVALRYE